MQVVILSKEITKQISERLPKTEVLVFNSIEMLENYIAETPVRANITYVATSVLEPRVHSNLSKLIDIVDNNYFFKTEEVVVLTTSEKVIKGVDFVNEEGKVNTEFKIKRIKETRTDQTGYITGDSIQDVFDINRKSVYRIKKEEYIEVEKKRNRLSTEWKEENPLRDVKDIDLNEMETVIVHGVKTVKEIYITGKDELSKSLFALVLGQYTSITGKTLIIESDFKYNRLTYMARRAGINYLDIPIERLFNDPKVVLDEIGKTRENLIILTSNSTKIYQSIFLTNLIYANIGDSLSNIIVDMPVEQLPENVNYYVVFKNNLPDILEMVEHLPRGYSRNAKFICIADRYPNEIAIQNSRVLEDILKDLLSMEEIESLKLVEFPSLKLKGNLVDLGGI